MNNTFNYKKSDLNISYQPILFLFFSKYIKIEMSILVDAVGEILVPPLQMFHNKGHCVGVQV